MAFEIVGAMSIMTNCGLLALSPQMKASGENFSPDTWILMFVVLEHILLGIRYVLHKGIPDKPEWVRVQLAKKNFESRQALKHEVIHIANLCYLYTHLKCYVHFSLQNLQNGISIHLLIHFYHIHMYNITRILNLSFFI